MNSTILNRYEVSELLTKNLSNYFHINNLGSADVASRLHEKDSKEFNSFYNSIARIITDVKYSPSYHNLYKLHKATGVNVTDFFYNTYAMSYDNKSNLSIVAENSANYKNPWLLEKIGLLERINSLNEDLKNANSIIEELKAKLSQCAENVAK